MPFKVVVWCFPFLLSRERRCRSDCMRLTDEVNVFSDEKLCLDEDLLCPSTAPQMYEDDVGRAFGLSATRPLSLSPILDSSVVSAPSSTGWRPGSPSAVASVLAPRLEDFYALQNAKLQPWALRSLASSPVTVAGSEGTAPEVAAEKGVLLVDDGVLISDIRARSRLGRNSNRCDEFDFLCRAGQ